MARMQIIIDDDLEEKFRRSFKIFKKGNISKKIEELIRNNLKNKVGEEMTIKQFADEIDKMIYGWYNRDEFCGCAIRKTFKDWKNLKKLHQIETDIDNNISSRQPTKFFKEFDKIINSD